MSLYGERCGALSVICPDADQAQRVLGQLKFTVRRNYSSPPAHGGQIAALVLSDPALRSSWERDLETMRLRILEMRKALHQSLSAKLPGRDFGYLLTQRGMFSYTGLNAAQADELRERYGVYILRSGRVCIACLNPGNIEPVASAFAAVIADNVV
jgi:aromatic-amino-acid transaminase